MMVSVVGFRGAGFGFHGLDFDVRVSGSGFLVSWFGFRRSGFGFRISGLVFGGLKRSGFRGAPGTASRTYYLRILVHLVIYDSE
jgi:hypothetical protein